MIKSQSFLKWCDMSCLEWLQKRNYTTKDHQTPKFFEEWQIKEMQELGSFLVRKNLQSDNQSQALPVVFSELWANRRAARAAPADFGGSSENIFGNWSSTEHFRKKSKHVRNHHCLISLKLLESIFLHSYNTVYFPSFKLFSLLSCLCKFVSHKFISLWHGRHSSLCLQGSFFF